ncbi:MAG: M14 family metallopeptidase, partial [Candidatus Aminicenantes bacterium]
MRKILKIILFSFLGLIVAAYLFLFFSFNGYKPSAVEYEILPAALDYFHITYEDCRSAFIEKANLLVSKYKGVEVFNVPVPSETDPDLTIDFCYIPAQVTMDNLLILSSGIHGIEGFAGSAVQLMVMEEVLSPGHLDTRGILLIHGMNPYGFKRLRRVTENNVDMNRNCAVDKSLFNTKNEGYGKLYGMLNPQGEANHRSLKNKHMHLVMFRKILAESMLVLRQAILQGQYDYPEGLYFGGKELEPQIVAITP